MSTKLRRRKKEDAKDLELTTFLNLLIVLIAFLLVTAVFTRMAVQSMKLPTAAGAGGAIDTPPPLTIEVVLRMNVVQVQLSRGGKTNVTTSVSRGADDKFDLGKINDYLQGLKNENPDKSDVTLLVEPDVNYKDMILVMDAIKIMRVPEAGKDSLQKLPLFPDVSIGDAP